MAGLAKELSREDCIAQHASGDTFHGMKRRSEEILAEMDQQIQETTTKLEKMKSSREAAQLCYTKLFAMPVQLVPAALALASGVAGQADDREEMSESTVGALESFFIKRPKAAHTLPTIREGLIKKAVYISDPYLASLLAALVAARKIKRTERGVYAHISYKATLK